MGARAFDLEHGAQSTAGQSDGIGCAGSDLQRGTSRSREVYGAFLATAREGASFTVRGLAHSIGVTDTSVHRWESGAAAWPPDLLDRLPLPVAVKLLALLTARVERRESPLSAQEIERSLDRSIGRLMTARAEGRVDAGALLALADAAQRAAGRASGGER